MKKKLFISSLLSLSFFSSTAQDFPSWAKDLNGANLKEAIRINCYPESFIPANDVPKVLLEIDSANDSIYARFSGKTYSLDEAASKMSIIRAVPDEWFRNAPSTEKSNVLLDLFNIFPCEIEVLEQRKDYMPGTPQKILWDNGVTFIGEDEKTRGVWRFPNGFEGELSRAFLYIAAVHPMDFWGSRGSMFMADGNYPSLTSEATELLLTFHSQFPPSQAEQMRNERIKEMQGNGNPFIEYPLMAEYVWGTLSNDNPGNGSGDIHDDDSVAIDLKPTYSLSENIVLTSPYIPEDATWKINGVPTSEKEIEASALGEGLHKLEFDAANLKGKLIIEIVK